MSQTVRIGLLGVIAFGLTGCGASTNKPPVAAVGAASYKPDSRKPSADRDQDAPTSQTEDSADAKPPSSIKIGQVEPAELIMPKVALSDAHAKTCLIQVGDTMPAINLKDVAGKPQSLEKLLGEQLTVVTFWSGSNRYALEELADLGPDVLTRFSGQGVKVVSINERDRTEAVRKTVQNMKLAFPTLLDTDGKALAQCATQRLPRTYLLDSKSKILWFDIEYSRSTRRELLAAIRFSLSQG